MKNFTQKKTVEFEDLELRERKDFQKELTTAQEMKSRIQKNLEKIAQSNPQNHEPSTHRVANQFNATEGLDNSLNLGKMNRGYSEIERLNKGLKNMKIDFSELQNLKH